MTIARSKLYLFQSREIVSNQAGPPSKKEIYPDRCEFSTTPYVPIKSDELVKSFNKGIGGNIHEARYPLAESFTILSPKDLANFSKVSKGCYIVTKRTSIWMFQFKKLFSNVNPVSKELCNFNVEERFKIFYKRVEDEKKPFINQYNKNEAELRALRGPTGLDGEVDRAWKGCQQAVPDYDESHPALEKVKWKFEEFTLRNDWRKELGGDSYDGTSQTLDSDSLQGELLAQIEHGVSDHFNNQKISNVRTCV